MATEPTSAAGQAAEAGPGMPQLDFSTWGNQIFWLVLAILAIYFVLSRVALPRIAAVLSDRQDRISNDIAKAEELKRKATEAEEAYEKALADARSEAQAIAQRNRDEIKEELVEATRKAEAEIAAKAEESDKAIAAIRDSAMENVEAVAKDTAEALVAALGGKADSKAIGAAVSDRMKG